MFLQRTWVLLRPWSSHPEFTPLLYHTGTVDWAVSWSADVYAQLGRVEEAEGVRDCLSGRFQADRVSGALQMSVSPGTELLSLWVIGFLLPSRTDSSNL